MHQVTYVPRKTNHLLHLVLTFATCGAWALVWPCVALYNHITKDKVRIQQMWSGPSPYAPGLAPAQMPVDTSTWPRGQTGYRPHSYGALRPDGVSVFTDGQLAFGPRCGSCAACLAGESFCIQRDGWPAPPPLPQGRPPRLGGPGPC